MNPIPAPPHDDTVADLAKRLLDTYRFCDADMSQTERFTVLAEQALDIVEEWGWVYLAPLWPFHEKAGDTRKPE